MTQRDHGDIERWIQAAVTQGNSREFVESLLRREHEVPVFCKECDRPLIDGEDVDGFMSVSCHDINFLCEECSEGDAGHAAFHANVQHELDGMIAHSKNAQERWQSHRIAVDEHRKCPWAERGGSCDIVDRLKRDREHEDELCREAESETADDTVTDQNAP